MAEQSLQKLNSENLLRIWTERIAACRSSGQHVEDWCRENAINRSTYYRWQRRIYALARQQETTEFAEVSITQPASGGAKAATLRINGQEADIYAGIDEGTLETICRVLKQC